MYPKDTNESEKFYIGIKDSLHSDETRDGWMAQLTDENVPVPARIGGVAGQVVSSMVKRIKKQAEGRKPHQNILLQGIKLAINEVSQMAMIAGVEVSPEEKKDAAKIAGDIVESGETAPQGQQAPPQAPQQGLVGGVING